MRGSKPVRIRNNSFFFLNNMFNNSDITVCHIITGALQIDTRQTGNNAPTDRGIYGQQNNEKIHEKPASGPRDCSN